ncbi:hypothetical protein AAC691_08720 [Nguyenibacter vanlangensis]|uniref:DUF4440 domain-containing protein n=1 Tax=Nguyenibacter vanlangensis TaxID=1216886 RepID=A0ABZ3D9U9_9PROT
MENLESAVHHEIVELHNLLQDWFRAKGADDKDAILERFDPAYTMIGAAGRLIGFTDFAAALPNIRGTRPGLVMEIHDVRILHAFAGGVAALYREVQIQGDARTDRWSTAIFVASADSKALLWKHLQETFLP